jgi:protein SCO1/2
MKRLLSLGLALGAAALASAQTPLRYEQRIGAQLPLSAALVDEAGTTRPLGDYFGRRPVLLLFGYYKCPQLCSVLERSTIEVLQELQPSVGRDFDVIYVSIDPTDLPEDARREQAAATESYGRPAAAAGWHELTGPEAAVRTVAAAAGFEYRYDPLSRQYAHATGFAVVTPSGVISRYFLGLDFPPADLAAALRRAALGKTGEPVYDLVLECFRGSGFTGRYGRWAWRALQGGVSLTLLGLFGGIGWMLREEFGAGGRRKGRRP